MKRNGTQHTLSLSLPKHRSAAEKATVPRPFGAQASWAGWKQHISQHLPTLLLSVTSLVIHTCCSLKACSVISSAVSYMYISIHTSFVAVLTFLLQIFVPQIKTALHIFILSLLHIHPLFFFFFLLFCHLSPSPGMQTLDAQILHLWWRDLSSTPLLEEKRRGRVWGVSQCARCRSYEMASTDLRLHDSND